MLIAYWVLGLKIHTYCVVLIAFPPQQRLHERSSMLGYTYIVCVCYEIRLFIAGQYIMDTGNSKIAGRLELTFHLISLFPCAVCREFMSALLTHVAVTGM